MRKLKTRLFTSLLAVMLCCTALTPCRFRLRRGPGGSNFGGTRYRGRGAEPLTPRAT